MSTTEQHSSTHQDMPEFEQAAAASLALAGARSGVVVIAMHTEGRMAPSYYVGVMRSDDDGQAFPMPLARLLTEAEAMELMPSPSPEATAAHLASLN